MLVWMSKEEKKEYDDYKSIIKYENICCECGKMAEITNVKKLCLQCSNNDVIAVSYTHLDVYKRQIYNYYYH